MRSAPPPEKSLCGTVLEAGLRISLRRSGLGRPSHGYPLCTGSGFLNA